MSLLTIVQDAAGAIGLPEPSVVVTSTDENVKQMRVLVNREGQALSQRTQWQELIKEASHTTLAAELQGTMASIAPNFRYVVNETMWNDDLQRPVPGSLTPAQWQQLKVSDASGPYHAYRIQNKSLYLYPAPTAGETVKFEYMSKNWVLDVDGTTTKPVFVADDDTGLLDEEILTLGLIWRWKRATGLDYAEDYREYSVMLADAEARNTGNPIINASGRGSSRPPVSVPDGNWSP